MKDKNAEPVIITNAQMEAMLKTIPAGWTIAFMRPILRPDIIEVEIKRGDGMKLKMKTTGAMLLENPTRNFLEDMANNFPFLRDAKEANRN